MANTEGLTETSIDLPHISIEMKITTEELFCIEQAHDCLDLYCDKEMVKESFKSDDAEWFSHVLRNLQAVLDRGKNTFSKSQK
tara:strand:- start:335 stop:583 length:249 start_codon:yes stop_codon:yes gene_type:complete